MSDAASAGRRPVRYGSVAKVLRCGATTLLVVLVGLLFADDVQDAAVAGMFGRHRFFGMVILPSLRRVSEGTRGPGDLVRPGSG